MILRFASVHENNQAKQAISSEQERVGRHWLVSILKSKEGDIALLNLLVFPDFAFFGLELESIIRSNDLSNVGTGLDSLRTEHRQQKPNLVHRIRKIRVTTASYSAPTNVAALRSSCKKEHQWKRFGRILSTPFAC